jgi:hypothetical protein
VRTLVDATWPAGEREVPWDARDAAGRAVPPGVYLVRLDVGPGKDAAVTQRLVLTRGRD